MILKRHRLIPFSYSSAALLLVMILWSPVCNAQKATATLDTTVIRIGEQVRLHLGFTAPRGVSVQWPMLADTLNTSIEVVKRGNIDTTAIKGSDLLQYRQYVTITSFDSGYHTIPSITFFYRGKTDSVRQYSYTDSLMMKVNTVAVDTTLAIRDIKAPMKQSITFKELLPFILIAISVIALAALFIYYLWRRKQNKPLLPKIVKPSLPAWQIALKELENLSEQKLWQNGRIKPYYSELSDILRRYLENQHMIPAVEMVTDEILDSCRENAAVQNSTEQLGRLLRLADLVKFAKEIPTAPQNEQSLKDAVSFVELTKPVLQPAPKETTEPIENKETTIAE